MSKSQNNFLNYFEYIFSLVSLLLISQAIIPLFLTGGANEGDGVDVSTLDLSINAKLSTLVYIITFILLGLRWRRSLATFSSNVFLWILLGVVCFSYFWSINPDQTLRFSIYAVGTTGFGLYLATRYSLVEQMKLLGWSYGFLLILSLLFAVAIPKYGIMTGVHEGALRGVFTHKNQFGAFMAPGGVIFLLNAFRGERYSWFYWTLLVLNCGAMIMSQSTTAVGTFGLMLILCIIYRIFRWRYEVMISAVLGVTIVGFMGLILFAGYVGSDSLFSSLGKDATLSGRTDIWRYVWDQIQLKPWLGYGMTAFWNGLEGPSGYIQYAMRIAVIYSHNGFLDLWLSIGIVGLGLFLVSFIVTIVQSLALLRQTNNPEGFWPLLFLSYILLSNLTEGTISNFNSSFWAIYVAISYSLVIAKREKYAINE
ncbi:MAG: O-antigen ligase family protein [Hydrococcus sp. SU_1_0]|nr:O-antigen ligase family protein [Hydrococcus sp. SU_1_0]